MKKNVLSQCIAAYLISALAFGTVYVHAQDDHWDDFDTSVPLPPVQPAPAAPSYSTPSYDEPSYDEPSPPPSYGGAGEPETPSYGSYGSFDVDDAYSTTATVDQTSINFIKVIRHPRQQASEFQDAVIEGLQVSTEKGKTDDEVIVTCYFIFRDKPTSYFYDINRRDRKLVFEFVDTRTGSSPIAALEQAPIKEIVIDEMQVDANKDIKGLNPEWHDMIRITFHLDFLPVISVSDESNIISFKYKWTTDPSKYQQYIEANRFPLVFWISGGVLGAIGIGALTWFLLPKKETADDNTLTTSDLPSRRRERGRAR